MKNTSFIRFGLLLIILIALVPTLVHADRSNRGGDRKFSHSSHNSKSSRTKHISKDYRFDKRYRHDRSYPRSGYSTNRLPLRRSPIYFRNKDYYYQRGIWYRPSGSRFTVVVPPFGIVVPILPPFYTTLWVASIPYYYANNIYYTWRSDRNGYVVTEPPEELVEQEPALMADELYIYPKNGQNEQQQADDRYACHRWSVSQTKYDPTQSPGNISAGTLSDKRENYQRAMRACLEGKDYSVR